MRRCGLIGNYKTLHYRQNDVAVSTVRPSTNPYHTASYTKPRYKQIKQFKRVNKRLE